MRPLPTLEAPREMDDTASIACVRSVSRCRIGRNEAGFTLLEMIISMVLLGIAVGVVGAIVVQATGGSGSARAGAVSDAAISRAMNALADDVAMANTADRRDNLLRDPADLAGSLQRNEPPYSSDPSTPLRLLDIDEVVRASSTELQVRSDVDRRAGVECVTWRAESTGGFRLRRLVGTTCGNGNLSNRVMLSSSNPAAARIDTSPFEYRLVCSRRSCPGSQAAASAPCTPWKVSTVSANQRRWVVGVDAVLGVVTEQRSVASGHGSMRIAIRSRDTSTYRRGLGC